METSGSARSRNDVGAGAGRNSTTGLLLAEEACHVDRSGRQRFALRQPRRNEQGQLTMRREAWHVERLWRIRAEQEACAGTLQLLQQLATDIHRCRARLFVELPPG